MSRHKTKVDNTEREIHSDFLRIEQDIQESEQGIIIAEDDTLITAASKDYRDSDPEYIKRNRLYTDLMGKYIELYRKKESANRWYKGVYFGLTMAAFVFIIGATVYALCVICKKENIALADLGVILGGVSSLISVLIIIPKIIAEYLFPSDERNNMIELLKSMQENDASIRENSGKKQESDDRS